MKLGNPGAANVNLLFSDDVTYRNEDYFVAQGNAFYWGKWVSPTATKFASAQLLNPTDSGVTLLLDTIIITSDTSQIVRIIANPTVLSSLAGNAGNKDLGQSGPAGTVRFEAAASIYAGARVLLNLAAGTPFNLQPKFPWKINVEESMIVQAETANTGVTASFMWREV